jgi:AraC-like DNA-binding protein
MEMSKSTLAKRSRELLAETPSHYLLRIKIDAAAARLSMTNRPIKEISFELGFPPTISPANLNA